MNPDKKTENSNSSENQKQTEDFKNIPAASDKKNPPDIDKHDIAKVRKSTKTERQTILIINITTPIHTNGFIILPID